MSTDVLAPRCEAPEPILVGTATLQLVRSPVRAADGSLRVLRQEVLAGQTVAEVLPSVHQWARVIWNGKVLTPEEQQTQVLRDGDEVTAFPTWGADPFTWSTLIYIGIGLAVSFATQALSYALFPPKKPNAIQPEIEEPTESFEGIRTTVGPGAVVPVIYGRRRIGGQLLSAQVVQALTIVDGPVPVGGAVQQPIVLVEGGTLNAYGAPQELVVVTVLNHGATTGTHVDIGAVQGKTNVNGGWIVRVLDVHRLELLGSIGIDPRPYAGGGVLVIVDDAAPGTRRIDAVTTPPTLTMLLALGEGPIAGVLWETVEINGQPLGNFPTAQVFQQLGTPDQLPMPEFGETANTFADGRDLPAAGGSLFYTTTVPVQAFVLNIGFNQGLYFLNTKGEKEENRSTIGYRYRASPAGAWTALSFFDIAAARTSIVRCGIRREGLPLATYDIEVVWSHAFHVDEGRAQWVGTLDSITEILHNTHAYPNTALLGLRAVPTESLQGGLPNITTEILGRTVRLNEFIHNLNWTENPAWAVMDLLTHPRYGLNIPESEIDLPGFAVWAAYCDELEDGEKRHTLNYVLDHEQRAQAAILEICGGSRTLLLKSEGVWTPRPTRSTQPVQLLSWANVSNVKLTYTRDPDRINVVEARFTNEEEKFEQGVLTWPMIGGWPATLRKASVDIRGVTKPSRVIRELQFDLNRRRFELLSLECDCALDAMILQPHDIFRFSHPLPGWGTSGRVRPGSTVTTVFLDTPVTFQAGLSYHLYLRFDFDATDVKPVVNPGTGTYDFVVMAVPFEQLPTPDVTLWAFGESSPVDTAVKLFRVVRIQRRSDTTVHLQAIAHNPSIYTEAVATPLPPSTSLPNPISIPPPLVSLVATEVVKVQTSGASLRAVDLSWDVAALSGGFAPYGGAAIFRRSVVLAGQLGQAVAGTVDLGALQDPNDPNVNFVPIASLRGHVLDYEDYQILQGATYLYRVVPMSGRGVPNNNGAREAIVHIAGPTTAGYYPGTPLNLRLRGQAVGATLFEGRDIHIEWDSVASSPLFSTTFFVTTYTVEMWAPAQLYLMRRTIVPAGAPGQTLQFSYTFEQNIEDNLRAGMGSAARDVLFQVFANANTGVSSLIPATLTVHNPPPDMSEILPYAKGLFEAAIIRFDQWIEPRDFSHYTVFLDTVNPPVTVYQDLGVAFQELAPMDLPADVPHYVYILPHDTFGAGIASQIATFTPVDANAVFLDTVPPGTPTGLVLTTGSDLSDDGTVMTWVRASWDLAPESDAAGYEVHVFLDTSPVPTVYNPQRTQNSIQFPVPGNILVRVKLLAFDRSHNTSAFTAEATITTGKDTTRPGPAANLVAIGGAKSVNLLWTPSPDPDYAYAEVWSSTTNNRATAQRRGQGTYHFLHEDPNFALVPHYYWILAVDTSGNFSNTWYPASPTTGIVGTPGQLDTTFISSLAANKILTGILTVLVSLGVNNIMLDGVASQIYVYDNQVPQKLRVNMGKLGALSDQWGLQIFGPDGTLMWNLATGATEKGISDAAVLAQHIRVGQLQAEHVTTASAFITDEIQIATAIINNLHVKNAAIRNAHIRDGEINAVKIQDANILRAHIQDLAVNNAKIADVVADKITTGTLNVHLRIGVGDFITLDGPNHLITIRDAGNYARVYLGNVSGFYGLEVRGPGPANAVMWNFTDGATTAGLAPAAVTTPKITANAVTASILVGVASEMTATSVEIAVASVVWPVLEAGDTLLLLATSIGTVAGNRLTMRLRHDNTGGAVLAIVHLDLGASGGKTPMALHALYPVPALVSSKTFVVTIQEATSSGTVSVQDVSFTTLRLQR